MPAKYWRKSLGQLKVISHSAKQFLDRREAGALLAKELGSFPAGNTVTLGIPRGGVVIAAEIARLLNTQLDIVLSRKIGAPAESELAIGSVGEDGSVFINRGLAFRAGADQDYIEQEKNRQLDEIKNRIGRYRKIKPKVNLKGKIVIVTDDGIATGATMQSALLTIRHENPQELIAAIPVAAASAALMMVNYADQVIVLRQPEFLGAISQFYKNFEQVNDEGVIKILKEFV